MFKNVKAVIFDLDGTLVDSMWIWHEIDNEYLARYGLLLPPDYQQKIAGMSLRETAIYTKDRFKLPDPVEVIEQTWDNMAYEKYSHEVFFKKGAKEFVKELRKRGIKTGIATSNSPALLEACISALDARSMFDAIHNANEVEKGKPAPDLFLYVADRLSAKPSECLVFEDIVQGIMAGHAANMKVCAVEDDFSKSCRDEIRAMADYYISDYSEVIGRL